MIGFLLRRILLLTPTLFGITLVAFGFVRVLPGDPVLLMAGERGLTPERYAQALHNFGYDQPLWRQYVTYLADLLRAISEPRSSPRSPSSPNSSPSSRRPPNSPSAPSSLPSSSASRPGSSRPAAAAPSSTRR